jgi:hypothetical protein
MTVACLLYNLVNSNAPPTIWPGFPPR